MDSAYRTWFPAPVGGEAPSLPPDQLRPTQARSLRNFLVHHPGRIVPRGKLGGTSSIETGSLVDTTNGGTMLVVSAFDDHVTVGYRAPSAGPLVDYWRVPVNRPTLAAQLAQPSLGATSARSVDLKTGTVTNIANAAATSASGPSITRVDDALYTATFGGASTAIPTGVAPLNNIRKADVYGSAAVLTTGPKFVQAVFSHAGRLWAAAARSPGLADYDTSQIFYTIPGGTTAFLDQVTDWQDPISGELNAFNIGAGNDGDFVVGFGRAAGQLIVFKRNSIYVLYGTDPATFTLRQLRTQSGCVDFRSITVADEGVYFASQLGYELWDGNRFTLLSEPIADVWLPISNAGVAGGTQTHAYIKAGPLPNGYLYVSMGTDGHTANSTDGTERGWLLHRKTGAWVDLRTAITSLGLGGDGYLNLFVLSRSHVVAFGAARWSLADYVAYGAVAGAGVFDQDASSQFSVDLLWTAYLDNLGSYRGTDGRWATNKLQSATVDYHHHYTNSTPPQLDPFGTLTAADGFGAAVVPAAGDSTPTLEGYRPPGPVRSRQVIDMKHETNRGDISFTLRSTLGSSSSKRTDRLDVYGIGVTYQHGRERRLA